MKALIKLVIIAFLSILGIWLLMNLPARVPVFRESKAVFEQEWLLEGGRIGFAGPKLLEDHNGDIFGMWIKNDTTKWAQFFEDNREPQMGYVGTGRQLHGHYWPFSFTTGPQGRMYLVQATAETVFFSYTQDKGKTWVGPVEVNDDQRKLIHLMNPTLTFDQDNELFLIYNKRKPMDDIDPWKGEGGIALYMQTSKDGGKRWTPGVQVKDIEYVNPATDTLLLGAGDRLFFRYDNRIYRSSNKGKNWRTVFWLKKNPMMGLALKKDAQENLYVAWAHRVVTKSGGLEGIGDGHVDVHFNQSGNKGATWGRPVRINDVQLPFKGLRIPLASMGQGTFQKFDKETMEATVYDLAVSKSGKFVGILWEDWRSGKPNLYFSYSVDKGKNWSKNIRVNRKDVDHIKNGSLVISDDGIVYALWIKTYGTKLKITNSEIYFSKGRIHQ